jgi:hypothetical protein
MCAIFYVQGYSAMDNRRRFPRFGSALQMKYGPAGNGQQFSYTISEDISKGGLRMPALSGIFKKGDMVKLDILPTYIRCHVLATGKVKWVKPINRIAPLNEEVGIEFVNADPDDIDRLIKATQTPAIH